MMPKCMVFGWRTAIAAIACALALGGPQAALAGLTLNLRFTDGSLQKSVSPADVGANIPIQIWATIDGVGGTNGSGNLFGLQFVTYSVASTRVGAGIDGALQNPVLLTPWDALPHEEGTIQQLVVEGADDGIADLGSMSPVSDPNFARPRAAAAVFNDSAAGQVQNVLVDAGGQTVGVEFLLETVDFHVSNLNAIGAATEFDVLIPSWILGGAPPGANWWQRSAGGVPANGVNNGAYVAGTSVTFLAVPEPASILLMAIGGAGLLSVAARRRRRRQAA